MSPFKVAVGISLLVVWGLCIYFIIRFWYDDHTPKGPPRTMMGV